MIRKRLGIVVLSVVAPLGSCVDVSHARDEQESLAALRLRISRMESHLADVRDREEDAESEKKRLHLQLELAEARVREARMILQERRDSVGHLQNEIRGLTRELQRRSAMVRASVQMAALLGRPGPLRLLSDAAVGLEHGRALDTVTALVEGQARLREEQWELRMEKSRKLEQLSKDLEAAAGEAETLQERRARLRELESSVEERLEQLRRTERRTRKTLDDLTRRAAALEALIGRLASTERSVQGGDIRRYRGALAWPVEGEVTVTFGKHRTARYATYTVCNGLRLDVDPGDEVRAVFAGEVAFARYFKGYGNMVVIDHGHDIYTVTAGLATLFVQAGNRVGLLERLGMAGPAQEDGNVYLEFRSGRQALDPSNWLRLKEGIH